MKMQQGFWVPRLYTQLRSRRFLCAAVLCALMTVVGVAAAEGVSPTPTHPVRPRHASPVTVRNVHEKSYAVTQRGRRILAQDVAPLKQGTHSSAKADARRSGESSAREVAPRGKAAPQSGSAKGKATRRHRKADDDDGYDPPAMYKVRAGRRGRGPMLVRVHGRWMAREPIANMSRFAPIGPAPLRGSHDILVHQNLMADDEGLERIQDETDLDRLRSSHDLVDFEESRSLRVNPELPWNRRCARVWTVKFAADLASAFYEQFGLPLQITSAARSVEYQMRLAHVNGNAAGIEGDVASPHLTGQAIDIGKRGMSRSQLAWMRGRLLPLIESGEIDVEEEFKQACFHISVYRSYLPVTRSLPKHDLAQLTTQPVTKSAPMRIPMTAPASSLSTPAPDDQP